MTLRPDRRQTFGLSALAFAAPLIAAPAARARQMAPAAEPAPPVTGPLSRFIAGSGSAEYPEEVRDLGRLHILDSLASAVACRNLEAAVLSRRFAKAQSGAVRRGVTMLATREKASLIDAAFASAMTIHAAEINDFIPSALVQPGPSVVGAALALAEQRRLSGKAVLNAVMVGYELCGRIPKALGMNNLRRSGLANHGIAPTFGSAAAAASLMRLPEDKIQHVLTYCSQQASGSWQWLLDVEHLEKSFVFGGMGVRAGLLSALLVEGGFTGVRANLDQPTGFMNQGLFTGPDSDLDRDYLVEDLGRRWELPLTAYKKFPTGGPTQPAVQALLDFRQRFQAADVQSILIEMPGRWDAFRNAEMPALNLRYLAAIIMIDRELDFVSAQDMNRFRNDRAVRAFMDKVDVVHDPAQEAPPGSPRVESARVIVTGVDGRREVRFEPYVVGFPSHPMSRAQVEEKAMGLMAPILGEARARRVIEATTRIETLPDAGQLARLIAS